MRPRVVAAVSPRSTLGPAVPLVAATRNPGKVAELRRLLAGYPWSIVGLDEAGVTGELEEPGPGYVDNALAKAAVVSAATGLCALADDSGIEVPALRGWPGPRSARWREGSDEDRLRGLIETVEKETPDDRRVRYVCVVALVSPDGEPVTARGQCDGVLVAPRGTGGFGYDPGFLSDDLGITFGEAGAEEKDRVSHRARAVAALGRSGWLDWSAGTV